MDLRGLTKSSDNGIQTNLSSTRSSVGEDLLSLREALSAIPSETKPKKQMKISSPTQLAYEHTLIVSERSVLPDTWGTIILFTWTSSTTFFTLTHGILTHTQAS